MEKRSGLTLVGVIVTILIILFLLAIIMPSIGKDKHIAQRVICGTNLKSLGTAMTDYADDYHGNFPQLPGNGPWSKEIGFDYFLEKPDFKYGGAQYNTTRTITASWYLLVKYADVSHKGFVCPASLQKEFDGRNPQNRDIVDLWDFGFEPHKYVSYAMHNPYGQYPADEHRSSAFAVAADMNPWFEAGNIPPLGKNSQPPQIIKLTDPAAWKFGLSTNHQKNQLAEGHNVLYADGHKSYETQSNVGVKKDNIFTFHSTDKDPTEQDIQGGTNPTGRGPENDAKSNEDSFLAI